MPTAAIYARKSKATEKGESLENQITRCKALCELRGWDYEIFKDYAYSGKNLDRPDFEKMMGKLKSGQLQFLVCYKLDRVSRSVNDFSTLIEELDSLGISFISIKENFDTSTPMGRAMMMITAVFAQLERETIAERVKDNMIDRAKLGKWNGGPVPYGFNVERDTVLYKDHNKKISKLVINDDESAKIKEFFNWYLESDGSIRNNVTKANEIGYKTKNDDYWSHNQMSRILQNPLYCIADEDAHNYFNNNTSVQIVNDKENFNGSHGLMLYNRRKPHKKTTREREQEDWILTIGEHKGIIDGEMYIKVQQKLKSNKGQAPRIGQGDRSPLTGLVKCGRCGSSMSIFASPKTNDKSKGYYYYFRCLTREQKAKVLCDNINVRADTLESLIVEHIKSLCDNKKLVNDLLNQSNDEIEDTRLPLIAKRNKIQAELDSIEKETDNLVDALGKGTLPELIIKRKYNELENKKSELKKEYEKACNKLNSNYIESFNLDTINKYLNNFNDTYEFLDFDEKKKLLHSIVKEITIDRDKVMITLYFLPGTDYNAQTLCSCKDIHVSAKYKTFTLECNIYNNEALPENTLAQRVKKLRLLNNLNMKQLAGKCNISPFTISNIERGKTYPIISSINMLSSALNTTNKYLLNTNSWSENTIAQIIKKYRLIKGLTQSQLAQRCNLHKATIDDYESGKIKTKTETLKIIFKCIGYKTDGYE